MRVLFANNLRGYYGGVEQIVVDYARGLGRRGNECFLAYGKDARDPEAYSDPFIDTSACSEFGCGNSGTSFSAIVNTVKPDVVFVHKLTHLPNGLEKSTAFHKVLMVHDHDLWCPKGTGYYTFNHRTCHVAAGLPCYLDGAFLKRSEAGPLPIRWQSIRKKKREMARSHHFDTILVLSEYLERQLVINGFPPERIRIHKPIVNLPTSEPLALPKARKVLFVGSLIRGKGVDLLLRALAAVKCDFQLDIVGSGESEKELRALATKLQVDDRVNFLGWVPHDDLLEHYQAARIVAIPSCWPEPFGLTGQEAMHCARPVVAFSVGGIPDWCDDGITGFTVPEQDVAAFAAAMERLLTDHDLAQEMGRNGLRKVKSQLSFEVNIDNLEHHLEKP